MNHLSASLRPHLHHGPDHSLSVWLKGPTAQVLLDIERHAMGVVHSVVVFADDAAPAVGIAGREAIIERLELATQEHSGATRWLLDEAKCWIEAGRRPGLDVSQGRGDDRQETTLRLRSSHGAGALTLRLGPIGWQARGWIRGPMGAQTLSSSMVRGFAGHVGTLLLIDAADHAISVRVREGVALAEIDSELVAVSVCCEGRRVDSETLLELPTALAIVGEGLHLRVTPQMPVGAGPLGSTLHLCVKVAVAGSWRDKRVAGKGVLMERRGAPEPLERRFERAGEAVQGVMADLLPSDLQGEALHALAGRPRGGPYLRGLDGVMVREALVEPIRMIADRGGKAWRSCLMQLCCQAVGGRFEGKQSLLAVPELVHVGSLIVDDVQDGSARRRGGDACHVVHGPALAINAGNAAYFAAELAIRRARLEPQIQHRVLALLFDGFRSGHVGQALDLRGLERELGAAAGVDALERLAEHVLTIHWLKSGVPAGAFARMGAVVGEGSEAQVEALGDYFEHVGTAFQIVDDVLNLRGFEGDLKDKGEDLTHGKATLPLVRSLQRVGPRARLELCNAIQGRPASSEELLGLIGRLEDSGGVTAAAEEAEQIVEDAWLRLDGALDDTMAKLQIRALSKTLLRRHY